jgi:hypothetical protein
MDRENEECNGDLPEKWPDLGPKAGGEEGRSDLFFRTDI